jgi:type IV secretion system protein VirB9
MSAHHGRRTAVLALVLLAQLPAGASQPTPAADARVRVLLYAPDEVYRLKGFVGYQIDLEFEAGERFVGLGSGDLESLTFAAQENHLFLKPRAGGIDTNLTVITSRRAYQFDYSASTRHPDPVFGDVVYVLRFTYPAVAPAAQILEQRLDEASATRTHNLNYGYCGSPQLKPVSAWDDGVQTRLRFAAQQELPALFVRNDDGSESLVNFTVVADELIVHRVSRRFVVRRGHLEGCIVNQGFTGSGESLPSGTVAPKVERLTRQGSP